MWWKINKICSTIHLMKWKFLRVTQEKTVFKNQRSKNNASYTHVIIYFFVWKFMKTRSHFMNGCNGRKYIASWRKISVNLIKERQYTHQIWPASSVKERWGENTLYARGQAVHWGQARARSRWQRPLNKAYHPPASHRRLVILTYRKLV